MAALSKSCSVAFASTYFRTSLLYSVEDMLGYSIVSVLQLGNFMIYCLR
jgi:hypothetical protein